MSDDVSIPNASYTARRAGRYGRVRGGGLTADNRRLLIYAGGLGGLLVVMVTASTLTSRHSGPVPVVEPDPRPLRVKPENPGGMQIDAAESDVFSGASGNANAHLAPPAEAPNPNGLQAQKPKPAPLQPPAAAPAPAKPDAAAAAEPPPAATPKPAATPAKPAAVAKEAAAPKAPATAKDGPAAAVKPTAVASATPAQPAATHGAAVQLAALSTEAAAREEWQKLQKQMPDMFGGKQPAIVKAERDGKTFWRLRAGGFADVAQARSFCDRVRGKGGACTVAEF